MNKMDVTCPGCGAGFRRLELSSQPGSKGEYHCPACDTTLEKLDAEHLIIYRLTIQPERPQPRWRGHSAA